MNLYEYQIETRRTASEDTPLLGWAVGLAGETGEVCEIVKKAVLHRVVDFKGKDVFEAMESELGDVLWYLTRLADSLGLNMQSVLEKNVDKLRSRYPDGFVDGGGVR